MYNKDEAIIHQMLEIIDKILIYTESFSSASEFVVDNKSFDATLMNFIALGEFVIKLSNPFKKSNPEIDWLKIYDFRNIIAHDYFGIDEEEVFQIIRNHIPKLKSDLEKI